MKPQTCSGVVVVIEDEEDSRELLCELLESQGYTVATAGDGAEGLEVLARTPQVCFVLLDFFMPRMDGFQVLDALAADPKLSLLPLCITTSAPDRVPPGRSCLPKPIDIDRLYALIDEHCSAKAAAPA